MQRIIPVPLAVLLLPGLAFAEPENKSEKHPHERHLMMRWGGGRLGIEALPISKEVREVLGAPADAGVLVNRVEPESAALEAGIKAGDVVVEIDGHKVASIPDIRQLLADKETGQKANLVVVREKSRKTLTATMKEKSSMSGLMRFPDEGLFAEGFGPDLGKHLEKLQERVAEIEKKLQSWDSSH